MFSALSGIARAAAATFLFLPLLSGAVLADDRPNILWISCEDISPNLGCYGDPDAQTPNLDRLASQGARFDRCFSHAGVCAIARSGLISGMYPISIGSQHMRSHVVPPDSVKCFPEYLRAAGYWCTNRSKTDYNWNVPRTAWDENSPQSSDWRGRAEGQPFFSVINLGVSHESQVRSNYTELMHDPATVQLPPYIPDTPVTRRDWARYHDIVSIMDRQAGEILQRLEADGLAEKTIVFFWGDHGQGLPRGKRWIYDSGLRVPLIVRWPGTIAPGSVRDDLVCFLDFAPTVLSLAGVTPPEHMQGQVILGGKQAPPREYIFAHRDRMDEAYDLIRAVRDKRFKYIRNFMPERTYAQNIDYMNKMPTMMEMRRLHAAGKLKGAEKLYFRETKPVEELYDTAADPHEIHNLADSPEHQETLARLRKVLEDWQVEIGDLGLLPEPILMERMRPDFQVQTTATPVFSSRSQGGARREVQISCSTPGASIAYQLADDPADRWRLYTGPLTVSADETVRAVACRLGFKDSGAAVSKGGE